MKFVLLYTLLLHYYTENEEEPLLPENDLQIQNGMLLDSL